MKTFDYVRPATIAEAVAAAAEPGAAYLAGGTNLLDLMKGGIARPNRLVDVTRLPGLDRDRAAARWRRPDRRARAQRRSRARRGLRPTPSRGRRGAAVRRLGAASQCRDGRRQSAAAHAVRVFLRCRQRLQQARNRARAAMRAAARPGCTPCSAGARPASPPTRRISACRWSRSTPWWRSRAEPAGARLRLESSPPSARRHARARKRARTGRADRRRAAAGRGARRSRRMRAT